MLGFLKGGGCSSPKNWNFEEINVEILYAQGTKDHPTKEKLNYEFARFLRDEKLYKEAEFRYRKTSIIMPKEIIVYTEWGLMLDVQGKLEGQEELFRKVVEREPNSNHGLCNLGAILARKCKFEEAIDVFEKALVDRPNDTLILTLCRQNISNLRFPEFQFFIFISSLLLRFGIGD